MTEISENVVENLETAFQIPDNAELIDEIFYVWETRFGLYNSMTTEGRKMLTGGTKEGVVDMTRWLLMCEQDGTLHLHTRVVGDAFVGGKL